MGRTITGIAYNNMLRMYMKALMYKIYLKFFKPSKNYVYMVKNIGEPYEPDTIYAIFNSPELADAYFNNHPYREYGIGIYKIELNKSLYTYRAGEPDSVDEGELIRSSRDI